jgi:hypothetical protein
VAVRAQRIPTLGDAANGRNLGRHLVAQQDAALARFGSLRQLDLEGPHGRLRGQFAQARIGQVAVLVAYAVLRGTDLEDNVAATVQMSR